MQQYRGKHSLPTARQNNNNHSDDVTILHALAIDDVDLKHLNARGASRDQAKPLHYHDIINLYILHVCSSSEFKGYV